MMRILDKNREIETRINSHHQENLELSKAIENNLFITTLSELELLPYGLIFDDKRSNKVKGKPDRLGNMVRFDISTKRRKLAVAWLYFPISDGRFSAIECRLQKFGYSCEKVRQATSSDNRGYPRITVKDNKDIDLVKECIQEYMIAVHDWKV